MNFELQVAIKAIYMYLACWFDFEGQGHRSEFKVTGEGKDVAKEAICRV